MKIVTGYTGEDHVTANDAQGMNQGIFGTGNYVLDVGNKFSLTWDSTTTAIIADGEGIMQGVHFRIEPGETETVTLSSGTSGYSRYDLICARYTKDATTGVEDVSLAVIEGTPLDTSGQPAVPTVPDYNTGDILGGDSPVDFPLYRILWSGLTPVEEELGVNTSNILQSIESLASGKQESPDLLLTRTIATFSSGTISLDLSDYDYVDIVYTNLGSGGLDDDGGNPPIQRHYKGQRSLASVISMGTSAVWYCRGVTVSDTGLTFETCYYAAYYSGDFVGPSTNTQHLLPWKIYGGKF